MKNIVFSFLEFLSEQVGSANLTRQFNSSVDSTASLLKTNSTNITVLNVSFDKHSTEVFFAVDVIYEDENTCYDKVNACDKALRDGAYYAQLKDYTNPTSPTLVGKRMYFSPPKFKRISYDSCRFNTLVSVKCYERY